MTKRSFLLASVRMAIPPRAGAVDAVVDSLDNVPEALHAEYVERDGKFHLQVNGMRTEADFSRLQSAHTKEKNDHNALKARVKETFGDRKLEDVRSDLDRIPELEASQGTLDDEKINRIVEGRVKTALAPVERERDTLRTENGELKGQVDQFRGNEAKRKIRDDVRTAAKKAGVTDEALDDALLLGDTIFELREDDGKVVVKDGTSYTSGIEPSVLFADFQTRKPHWFGPTQGGGSTGNRGGAQGSNNPFTHANWNLTEQGKLINSDPAKANQLSKAAGAGDDANTAQRPPAPAGK